MMAKKSRSIDHANHNKSLCHKLFSDKEDWSDWVVTTAFYSAIHFVEHEIFPLKDKLGGKLRTFKDFNNYRISKKPTNIPTHEFRYELVAQKIPEISSNYKRLMDVCHTARYNNYQISPQSTQLAVDDLKVISEYCSK